MSQIYAIIPAAHAAAINTFFSLYGWGTGTFGGELTTDNPATLSSPVTHRHSYNAAAAPGEYSLFSLAKAGTLPSNDMNGDPLDLGEDEEAIIAAFAALELWANDSAEAPYTFAEGRRLALGISEKPVEV